MLFVSTLIIILFDIKYNKVKTKIILYVSSEDVELGQVHPPLIILKKARLKLELTN